MSGLDNPHGYPGMLIVVEGIDGSGKSTQLDLMRSWLIQEGYDVFFTEWNSSRLVKETTKRGKKRQILTPTTFSLIHCTDFSDRLERTIVPPLQAGMIVLADRYVFTAFCRDVARGVDPQWVRDLYGFAVRPDIPLYFRGAAGCGHATHFPGPPPTEILRGGHGPRPEPRSGRELREIPDEDHRTIRDACGRIRPRGLCAATIRSSGSSGAFARS